MSDRVIKFRAWHNGGKYPEEACMLYVGDMHGTRHPLDCCKFAMDGQPVTLMQFTGLHDKNGKEIYEGDILEWDGYVYGGKLNELCEWDYSLLDMRKNDWNNHCAVIGNVYENPELLEK